VIGQRCGGSYVIVSMLGQGGMGAVYLATSEMLAGKRAAVKVLSPELNRHSEGVARFRAEVYAAGKIDDPNIVKVFDAGELDGGRLYMMMEYCADGSLAALLEKRGPLPIDLVIAIACPVGSALHAAHTQAKITHRDIKPANILLVQEPGGLLRSKLADFGIAKLHDEQLTFGMRTGTQKILGSPGYMAPEQCTAHGGIDGRADVYAFGSVLYEMVTGRRPYSGDSVFELITQLVSNTPFPRPRELRDDLPPEWDEVIMDCLAHRREDRIPTVKEVLRRLAGSVASGESLMSYMAPRLIDDNIAPTAITISDGIGPAVTRWADAQVAVHGRGRRLRAGALVTLLGGILTGSVATALVAYAVGAGSESGPSSTSATEPPRASPPPLTRAGHRPEAVTTDAGAGATQLVEIAVDARLNAHSITETVDAGPEASRSPAVLAGAGQSTRSVRTSTDSAATHRQDTTAIDVKDGPNGPVVAGGNQGGSARSDSGRTMQAAAEQGSLRVEVEPWADVSVSGEKGAYTTPVTLTLSAGHHRVVLAKGARKETIDVLITPNQTTRITRSW
jgi:hypothetical protein